MTSLSGRIGSRVPPHDGRGVRCRLRHPAPLGGWRGGSVFGFGLFFLAMWSPRPPAAATRWGAVHSVLIETQMRLDFPSKRECSNTCIESHRASRTNARQEVSALLGGCVIPSTPRDGEERGGFWFLAFFQNVLVAAPPAPTPPGAISST